MIALLLACNNPQPTVAVSMREEVDDTGFPFDTRDDDGDGAVHSVDCDDDDPARHPGAEETCGDGFDQDCDGMAEECCVDGPAEATPLLTVRSDGAGDWLLTEALRAGDVDGDGDVELLVGERWTSQAWLVGLDGDTTLSAAVATWSAHDNELGATAALLPRAEGGAHVILGAPSADGNNGRVCAWPGDAVGAHTEDDGACWTGTSTSYNLGNALDSPGDLDGDGLPDLVLGDALGEGAGIAWLVGGDTSGDVSEAAFARISVHISEPQWGGAHARGVGDLDGDGAIDLLVGWDAYPETRLAFGPFDGVVLRTDLTPLPFVSPVSAATIGGPAGDLDGDGYPEVWSTIEHERSTPTGIAVWSGAAPSGPTALLIGESWDLIPRAAASPGDVDGDGADELVVSATDPSSELMGGVLYTFRGPVAGVVDLSCAHAIAARPDTDGFGATLDVGADVDGDGLPELLVGAPDVDDGGAVLVLDPTALLP